MFVEFGSQTVKYLINKKLYILGCFAADFTFDVDSQPYIFFVMRDNAKVLLQIALCIPY